jgi:hypothetical protein
VEQALAEPVPDPVPDPVAEAVPEEELLAGPLTLPEVLGLAPLLRLPEGEQLREGLLLLLLLPVAAAVPVGL